jgi:hypothetical protein
MEIHESDQSQNVEGLMEVPSYRHYRFHTQGVGHAQKRNYAFLAMLIAAAHEKHGNVPAELPGSICFHFIPQAAMGLAKK